MAVGVNCLTWGRAWGASAFGGRDVKTMTMAAAAVLVAAQAQAMTLFQNLFQSDPGIADCHFQCLGWTGAEDFTLGFEAVVTGLTLDAFHYRTYSLAGATIDWALWSDDDGPAERLV